MQISNKYQVMPPLTPEVRGALKEDMAENGVKVRVVVDADGVIIDGHCRVQIYHELLAEGHDVPMYPTETRSDLTTDAEKRDEARRLNMQRRNLSQAQKGEVIAGKLKESPQWADNRIGQLLGVDHKTVRVRRAILEKRGEIPKLEKLVGADGKQYPREVVSKPKEQVPVSSTELTRTRVEGPLRWPGAGATGLTRTRVEGPLRWPNAAPTPSPQVQPTHAPDWTDWTDEEQTLFEKVMAGETVVASMHRGGHPHLVGWARANGRFVRIDRHSEWGNVFELGEDGDRDTVVDNFEQHYLPYKPSLLNKLDELRGGKVLGCWCAPERCHGDGLKARAEA